MTANDCNGRGFGCCVPFACPLFRHCQQTRPYVSTFGRRSRIHCLDGALVFVFQTRQWPGWPIMTPSAVVCFDWGHLLFATRYYLCLCDDNHSPGLKGSPLGWIGPPPACSLDDSAQHSAVLPRRIGSSYRMCFDGSGTPCLSRTAAPKGRNSHSQSQCRDV